MLKASALYLVIIVALVIALLCSFLIMAAYFYKSQYQVKARYDLLQSNLISGVNLLTVTQDEGYATGKIMDLFREGSDSVFLKKAPWGLYEVGTAEAFTQRDTTFETFLLGNTIDSSKWVALYLIDEDRPLSVSGKTAVIGNVFLPKAGVRPAYVDNKGYEGDKRIVNGKTNDSRRILPPLDEAVLKRLNKAFTDTLGAWHKLKNDSLKRSFRDSSYRINFGKNNYTVQHISLDGNIILVSDTLLTIDSTATLNHVLVFAKAIVVKSGFHGNCQLFAKDSIFVQKNCAFTYPSCLGLLQFSTAKVGFPGQLSIGQASSIEGIVFTYQKEKSGLPVSLSLGKNARVKGQVYAQQMLQTVDGVVIQGSAFASRFLYQSAFTRYENYLINLTINSQALSRHYLTSGFLPVAAQQKKILQWLEVK